MNAVFDYVVARLSEKSTWVGILGWALAVLQGQYVNIAQAGADNTITVEETSPLLTAALSTVLIFTKALRK